MVNVIFRVRTPYGQRPFSNLPKNASLAEKKQAPFVQFRSDKSVDEAKEAAGRLALKLGFVGEVRELTFAARGNSPAAYVVQVSKQPSQRETVEELEAALATA